MLPWELAVYRVRKGKVLPLFRDLSGENWSTAKRVIDTFKAHEGKTKKELEESLVELTITPGYRFVKGLIRIMERKCIYDEGEDAMDFRRLVFKRYPEKPELRAKELGMSVEDMLSRMFSDINPRIIKVLDISANDLLMEYNLSLAQTMLFRAIKMETRFSSRRVYSALKYFGLLYTFLSDDRVVIDGPSSIFTSTTRYGTRFAKLLPYIVERAPWDVKAILKIGDEMPVLELDHLRHGYYFPKRAEEIKEDFEVSIPAGCEIHKSTEPLKVGDIYYLPNFKIVCGDRILYLEIFKFWTWSYISERAENAITNEFPLVFLLQKDGNVSRDSPGNMPNVLFFSAKIGERLISEALRNASRREMSGGEEEKRINREMFESLRKRLEGVESYEEAARIIEAENLPVIDTLHKLGYRIIWKGLMPHKIKKVS